MAEYLGLKWYERAAARAGQIDYRNGFYEREYVTPLGVLRFRVWRTRLRSFFAARDAGAGATQPGKSGDDSASVLARDLDARSGPGGVAADRRTGERPDGFAADAGAG